MPDNEKKFLALVEEVDIDSEGRVMVAEGSVEPKEIVREEVKVVYVDRYIENEKAVEEERQPEAEEVKQVEEVTKTQETKQVEEVTETEVVEQVEQTEVVEEKQEVLSVVVEETAAAADEDDEEGETGPSLVRYNKSFEAKLIQTQLPNQDYYTELKNELLSYKGVKSRMSWNFDTFNKGRKKCVRLGIKGKTLIIYLALDPKDLDMFPWTKYHQIDFSSVARFADYPFGMKVKSDRAVKYAKELIAAVMLACDAAKTEIVPLEYRYPYESTEALLERGLIKLLGESTGYEVSVTEGRYVEQSQPEVEETVEEEVAVAADTAAATAFEALDEPEKPKYVNKSFAQKMVLVDEVLQDRYDELYNYALRYKKLKARISKKFVSFNKGRLQFVKLSVAGKTLKLFLNMDINDTDPKFHCKDMTDKKTYVTVPVLLRVKSGRAVKYAKRLIDQCAAGHGLVENKKFREVDAISLVEEAVKSKTGK